MSLPEDLAGFSREELIELRLFGHIQVLEARIAELEGQSKPPSKERKPPSWVKANRPARSKGERRKRPHGFARLREEPTHRVEHATASCPDCQVPLTGGRVRGSRQVISLPRVRARVTEHVVLERACPKCRKRSPEPDWGALSVGRQRFGVSVQSEVSMLREECRLPFRVIQRYLKWPLAWGSAWGNWWLWSVGRRSAAKRNTYAKRFGPARWCTGTRRAVKMAVMATSGASALPRCATSSMVEEVLGDEFEGVLVSDFYGAYNVYQGPHQRCWTHLLRDIHQLKEQHPQDLVLARWAHAVREVYDHAQACDL